MKTHDHAAQLAEALRNAVRVAERDGMRNNPGSAPGWTTDARAVLTAWDKHNAPAPQQNALDLE